MSRRIRLFSADLGYISGLTVHTASSGAVARLSELYLFIEIAGHVGIGEVRTNIAYLNGLSPAFVIEEAKAAIARIDWRRPPEELLAEFAGWAGGHSAPTRMLLDVALQDHVARREGVSVAERLGAAAGAQRVATNQTLFWSSFEEFKTRTQAYVARGFHDLKVRIGIGSFDEDLQRLDWLRSTYGDAIEIAADVNGMWTLEEARIRLKALAVFGLDYVEQPVAAGDWGAIAALAETSPLPIMLDESMASPADADRVCRIGGQLQAHLKLVKLGGIGATVAEASKLAGAGIPLMVGQMNEGGAATAAALQVACAVAADRAELYGADGLADDPVSGLSYAAGTVAVADPLGLGVAFDPANAHQLMEIVQ